MHADHTYDPDGNPITVEEFEKNKAGWLPSAEDYDYVQSCMQKCWEVGKIANWIAPPAKGINENPFEYEYVKFH